VWLRGLATNIICSSGALQLERLRLRYIPSVGGSAHDLCRSPSRIPPNAGDFMTFRELTPKNSDCIIR